MSYSSKYLEKAVNEIAQLPGIGRKTALRLALHILKQDDMQTEALAHSLLDLKQKVTHCESCGNLSDTNICEICSNPQRNHQLICVVEDIRDVIAIENTAQYKGIYHVLGGVISPMDGVGPADLNIESLIRKVEEGKVDELIYGVSTTMEGETTTFYISRKLGNASIQQSVIARGIAVGDQLEYADELTLGRSIANRIPYQTTTKG